MGVRNGHLASVDIDVSSAPSVVHHRRVGLYISISWPAKVSGAVRAAGAVREGEPG